MPTKSRKERMALTLQQILDKYIAPEHAFAPAVQDARKMLDDYWRSRAATHKDAWERELEFRKRFN